MLIGLALVSMFAVSCGGSNDDELDPFIQMDNAQRFVNTYKSLGSNAVLVDIRSEEDYAEDHLDGALNLSVMKKNADGKYVVDAKCLDPKLGGTWPDELKALAGDLNKTVFIYGVPSFTYTRTIGGHASQAGFGREHTVITLAKLSDLKAAMGQE